ncbi:purine nucleoside phosphorylase LACC1-like [Salvelinus alpinus]
MAQQLIRREEEPESFDGIVTNLRDVVIAATGADCGPLLFTDPQAKVIGTVHKRWKGTQMEVAMATVNAMVTGFGSSMGPVALRCRESRLLYSIYLDCVLGMAETMPHVNIRLATRILLQRGGVLSERIHDDTVNDRPSVTLCTSSHPEAFFSRVRDGLNFGTQVGFLWMD